MIKHIVNAIKRKKATLCLTALALLISIGITINIVINGGVNSIDLNQYSDVFLISRLAIFFMGFWIIKNMVKGIKRNHYLIRYVILAIFIEIFIVQDFF